MSSEITPLLPAGIAIPDELEQAWTWMEEQGFGGEGPGGYWLTPYPGDSQLGIVFGADEDGVAAWFDDGTAPVDRLVPIAEIAGDGSVGALWLDDDDQVRFVGLGSEGDAHLLADDAVDFLRLVAVGYVELNVYDLGLPPEEDEAVEAVAQFRDWVEATFDTVVPSEWPGVGDDEFTDWVDALSGGSTGAGVAPEPDDSPGAAGVEGDVRVLLGLLGAPDGLALLRTVADRTGIDVPRHVTGLRWAGAELRSVGVEAVVRRGAVETIFLTVSGPGTSYPHPGELLVGLVPSSTAADVVRLLGEPEWQGPHGLRYVVDGRYLHLQVSDRGIEKVTLMRQAP